MIARYLSADTKLKTASRRTSSRRTTGSFIREQPTTTGGRPSSSPWSPGRNASAFSRASCGSTPKQPGRFGNGENSSSRRPAFLRHVYFVRDYASSTADPAVRRIIVRLQAAFAGPVELTVWLDEAEAADLGEG